MLAEIRPAVLGQNFHGVPSRLSMSFSETVLLWQ